MNKIKNTIIVLDDDSSILEVIKIILENKNYNVLAVSSSKDLLNLIKKNPPDLLIIDILLGGEDGRNICLKLKSSGKTKNIPIILISAHKVEKDSIKQCKADSFLPKPFDIDVLAALVKKLMNK